MQNRYMCKELYSLIFCDESAFREKLFETYFNSSCRYIKADGKVVCMAFFIDVSANGLKGKYVYAVATHPDYRNKGYMRKLLKEAEREFSNNYSFFCLHPASDSLELMYKKIGYRTTLVSFENKAVNTPLILLQDASRINALRKKLLNTNAIEYTDEYIELLLCYCDVFCDNTDEPTELLIIQKDGKMVEYINKNEAVQKATSMVKPLKEISLDGYYFSITLE